MKPNLAQTILNNDPLIIQALKKIIHEKYQELKALIQTREDFLKSDKYSNLDKDIRTIFFDHIHGGDQIQVLWKEIDSMTYEWFQAEKRLNTQKWEEKFNRARDFPIEASIAHLTNTPVISTNRNINCPLHQDKSPSFRIYRKSNSFFCFGCQTGGDVITLVMKLKDCDFKEAVNILSSL